jgi:hypothetical protein
MDYGIKVLIAAQSCLQPKGTVKAFRQISNCHLVGKGFVVACVYRGNFITCSFENFRPDVETLGIIRIAVNQNHRISHVSPLVNTEPRPAMM